MCIITTLACCVVVYEPTAPRARTLPLGKLPGTLNADDSTAALEEDGVDCCTLTRHTPPKGRYNGSLCQRQGAHSYYFTRDLSWTNSFQDFFKTTPVITPPPPHPHLTNTVNDLFTTHHWRNWCRIQAIMSKQIAAVSSVISCHLPSLSSIINERVQPYQVICPDRDLPNYSFILPFRERLV